MYIIDDLSSIGRFKMSIVIKERRFNIMYKNIVYREF